MAFEDRKNRAKYPLNAGSPTVFTIPAGGKILRGRVIITGSVVISGGNTNGTLVGAGGPVNLIKRITVTANRSANSRYPGGKIVDCSPRALLTYATTQKGKTVFELSGSTLGGGAAGTYPIYLSIPIYWADGVLRNEMSTALNADLGVYSSIQVQVDTASDLTGCFAGNDRTLNVAGLTVQWQDQRLALTGDTVPVFQEDHVMLIPSTFDRAQDSALPQDGAFTSLLLMSETTTARTFTDGLLNRVTLSGQTLAFDEYANDIRQTMIDDGFYDAAQSAVGQHYIDFTHGVLQNSNPAAGLLAQFDVNNISGANLDQIRFYTRRVFALAPAQ